ncbi:MAG: sulfatase [Lentisphaerae bacterium]|jgi:arylsulfatase A-like enzyme|nr:sulfatase [Lentisphaerota bacterium]MBT4821953.1 sulfatase [Lentisphaerota bacterium]MBT5605757.1 sulfatase [Lentisphaerota bacterium]MBT7053920.1 sulfatase [Lentisphaerota bacterium]MBT7843938.1 sulfatase [Lentisphaerota bacterium]
MDRRTFTQLAVTTGIAAATPASLAAAEPTKPNLVIIHTDEHNFRTLGCYREQLSADQAFVWGKGVKVDTPHIDSLARDGALCTSYYAASPVCTPSRASLISGLYPQATGAPTNNLHLNDDVVTFAEILRRNGYATSYVGKWHLDGTAKPGFAPKRKFGFSDNRYMFNRGHWKQLEDTPDGPRVKARDGKDKPSYNVAGADETSFATDFLTDRTIEIIKRDKGKPFCVLLSLPDPHGPNTVRPPYDTMYEKMVFENPRTMDVDDATMPKWVTLGRKNVARNLNQKQMAQYFGTVRCIDDNVGKILDYLKSQDLAKSTIVVFTSDHGDLMGEHKKHNKGLPYETSAGIPFVIRYPGKIRPGKIIHTAYTNADFAPTILSMMGYAGQLPGCHGSDTAADFLGPDTQVCDDRITYFTNAGSRWVAAVNHRYKLVLSRNDRPWLFDLQKDPDELTNFINHPEYAETAKRFINHLVAALKQYSDRVLDGPDLITDPNGQPAPEAPDKRKKNAPSANRILKPQDEAATGHLIDAADLEEDASGAKPRAWTRALTVPPGSFAANTTYELTIDWESKGLRGKADFFANFICDGPGGRKKQLATWKGDVGKTGTLTKELATDGSEKWTLAVGVRGSGHLIVKRIRIKRK